MLQNAYFLAKIGADTAENDRKFAENLPKNGNYPTIHLIDDAGIAREGVRRRAAPRPAPPRRERIGEGDYGGASV